MLRRLLVQVEADFLESLTRKGALPGVAELIWNAIDAEATNVKVSLVKNELLGISQIEVSDDGYGMTNEEADDSWPRCSDALAVLERRRRPDGRWQPGAYWWKPPGTQRGTVEVVDWGRSAPNEMITLNALRILRIGSE